MLRANIAITTLQHLNAYMSPNGGGIFTDMIPGNYIMIAARNDSGSATRSATSQFSSKYRQI